MPTACDDSTEWALRRGNRIGVDRLWIELVRESDDLLLRDCPVPVFVDFACGVVLEVSILYRAREVIIVELLSFW